jgi:competence protein ComEC
MYGTSVELHFLNVGHGDCTFVDLPSGRLMMIDINNSKSLPEDDVIALAERHGVSPLDFRYSRLLKGARSWQDYYRSLLVDPFDYYKEHFDGRSIFRYVQTHPDMDHMSGLHRFFWQEEVRLENFWDVDHNKDLKEADFNNSPHSYLDWLVYESLRRGIGPNHSSHKVIRNLRGATGQYWTDDGIEVFSPTTELIKVCNTKGAYNDCSYVLKISYGSRSVILPGDAEKPAWESMLDNPGADALDGDILKAPHHGRQSGYHAKAAIAMDPEIVVVSVGEKPETDASDEWKALGARVLSTRYNGTIRVQLDFDGEVFVHNHEGREIAHLDPLK